jgi:hypothetical protein
VILREHPLPVGRGHDREGEALDEPHEPREPLPGERAAAAFSQKEQRALRPEERLEDLLDAPPIRLRCDGVEVLRELGETDVMDYLAGYPLGDADEGGSPGG